MLLRGPLPARGWLFWGLVMLLLGATAAIVLSRRAASQPHDYRPAGAEPAAPLTLTNLRAI